MATSNWYERFRDRRRRPIPGGVGRADSAGGAMPESTTLAFDYLRESLRTNAPGYADQNYFQMSKSYVGAQYLGVNALSIQAGCAEARVFEQDLDDPDDKEPVSLHDDACRLIHQPNPDEDFSDILEQGALQHCLTGTGLIWAPHDPTDDHDVPEEMYVLSTASCIPQPISPAYPNGAYLVQPWYPAGPYAMVPMTRGVGAVVPAEQIIRVKTPHLFFRWIGYSVLYAISTQIDALRTADISRMNALTKGIDPTAVLTWDPAIKKPTEADLRRLEAQLQAVYAGPNNVGRIFMAPLGADIKTLSNTPKDMAYQEGWSQLADFTLAAIGVNKAVAGMTGELTYATLYASIRAFYLLRLDPLLARFARAFTRKLLHRFFGRQYMLEVRSKSITDEQLIEGQIGTLGKLGAIKIGELRKAYNKLGFPIDLEDTDRDDEWAGADKSKEGAGAGAGAGGGLAALMGGGANGNGHKPQPGDSEQEHGDPDQLAMQRARPENREGKGSLGPRGQRKALTPSDRHERIMGAFERAFSNGHARPHKGT